MFDNDVYTIGLIAAPRQTGFKSTKKKVIILFL